MGIEELKTLVRKAARGDREAAGTLFDLYYTRVYRYAYGKLHDATSAEDVASETFSVVLRELKRFKWKGAGFEAWLFRIAANLVTDQYRKTGREQPGMEAIVAPDVAEEETPESEFLASETSHQLKELIAHLPKDQQEVLVLRFVAGFDTNEAARVMDRKPNTIRQLQFRALENLRKRIGEQAIA